MPIEENSIYDSVDKSLYKIEGIKKSSIEINPENIVSGSLIASINQIFSALQAGKSKFDNTESGYILGLDQEIAKFYIGDTTSYLNWDGVTLTVTALTVGGADAVLTTGNQTVAGIKTFSSDPLIPDEVYGAGWNGSLEPPTKNAVYDKIETLGSGGITSVKNNVTTRAFNTASGDQTIAHGLGRTPIFVKIEAMLDINTMFNPSMSIGSYNGTTTSSLFTSSVDDGNGTVNGTSGSSTTNIITLHYVRAGSEANQVATIAIDGTNITLTWTLTGAGTAQNMVILWEAF